LLHAGYLLIITGGEINNFFNKEDGMLKQVLKTVASVAAMATLLASCSQNPAQVKTMDQNNLNTAAITPAVVGTPMHAIKIASNTGPAGVHIIGADGNIYKYNNGWVVYSTKPNGMLKAIAIPYNKDTVFVLAGNQVYKHYTGNQTSTWTQLNYTAPDPIDICGGGDPITHTTQLIYKLGALETDNYQYFYYYQNGSWNTSKKTKTPAARGNEIPTYPRPWPLSDRIIMDKLSLGFTRLLVWGGSPITDYPMGHVAWAWLSHNGVDHDGNPYNKPTPLWNGCGSLDVYGILPVYNGSPYYYDLSPCGLSLADNILCYVRHNDWDGSLYLVKVPYNTPADTTCLGRYGPGSTPLYDAHEVTCSGATGNNPWVIATYMANPTYNQIVWKYVNLSTGWTVP
jgi:hypothetical protein